MLIAKLTMLGQPLLLLSRSEILAMGTSVGAAGRPLVAAERTDLSDVMEFVGVSTSCDLPPAGGSQGFSFIWNVGVVLGTRPHDTSSRLTIS